jgi:hypothetical protein
VDRSVERAQIQIILETFLKLAIRLAQDKISQQEGRDIFCAFDIHALDDRVHASAKKRSSFDVNSFTFMLQNF